MSSGENRMWRHIRSRPDTLTSMFWNLMRLVFMIYDLIHAFLEIYVDGLVEMRPERIAQRCARSWLFPDIILVGVDLMISLNPQVSWEVVASPVASMMRLRLVPFFKTVFGSTSASTLSPHISDLASSKHFSGPASSLPSSCSCGSVVGLSMACSMPRMDGMICRG